MTTVDVNGKRIALSLTFGVAKRIRAETGIDMRDGEQLQKLFVDAASGRVDSWDQILRAMIGGDNADDTLNALDGDGLDVVLRAAMDEVINFFPRGQRETIRQAMRRHDELQAKLAEKIPQAMNSESVDVLADRIMREITSTLTSGSSPASPASPTSLT